MNAYYNALGVGDVLLLTQGECPREERVMETKGDVVSIKNAQGQPVAYNIFKASTYMDLKANGPIEMDEAFVETIQSIFTKNGVVDELQVDLRPKFIVGYVTAIEQHENADKLKVCQVDLGDETTQIVCGAANVDKDQKVVVARSGATMPGGMEIKPTNLRGVDSNGMICSREELGLPKDPAEDGIYILDADAEVGSPVEI